ncbi:MAG: FMN-dependent NADH-azoreductase [uncultured Sphingomonadaceae bacterium]|uniref:FMN dependent NADH:quinone oxidoreductase n=1 Tax=uncultured Sphingomonadaceae bacterium TaxID=169976 RepID=A0A6J4T1T2_9SPHN|nr:MAG: FMN-dependent NADH-azoreductase [uncultured Sphingomonadaceae bacterium]
MTKVLTIASSALGDASVSKTIAHALVDAMRAAEPGLEVVERDVGAHPLPHLSPEGMPAFGGDTSTPQAAATAALSRGVIDEVMAADVLVIASPMYNFGITSTLKAWFDHLLRAGITFRYTATGAEGLVHGKRAVCVVACGGNYGDDGPSAGSNHQLPHLRTLLNFIGITDVTFVRAEGLAFGPDAKAASIAKATAEAREVAGRLVRVDA